MELFSNNLIKIISDYNKHDEAYIIKNEFGKTVGICFDLSTKSLTKLIDNYLKTQSLSIKTLNIEKSYI